VKPLENMVEEKGIEPSTFALRMLSRRSRSTKSSAYRTEKTPIRAIFGHVIARFGHTGRRLRYLLFRTKRCKHVLIPGETHCLRCEKKLVS
jgi:hypothetical protein